MKNILRLLIVIAVAATAGCCFMRSLRRPRISPPERPARITTLEVTGYCPCRKCCGWKRNWWGRPVYASGPSRGKPKQVGLTANDTKARRGTIAADTTRFPFGTIMHIPGYGYGRVEDRGGAIKGDKIDLFFKSHADALEWGRQKKQVRVWLPQS